MEKRTRELLDEMFEYKSKLRETGSDGWIATYEKVLYSIVEMLEGNRLERDDNYLLDNDLAQNIYKKKYFLRNVRDEYIEARPEMLFARVSAFTAAVEKEKDAEQWALKFYNDMFEGYWMPGGRVMAGAGDLFRTKTLANCFVIKIEDDNLESIFRAASEAAKTYSYGGGVGIDITPLRPKDAVVHNAANFSSGASSFMELYSLTTGIIGQSGRRGALMLTIDIKHPDIFSFIDIKHKPNWTTNQIIDQMKFSGIYSDSQLEKAKKIVVENVQIRFGNISMKVNDEFMSSVIEQNTYGKGKILIYKKKEKGRIEEALHDPVESHYSLGIPSKEIEKYELIEKFDSIEQLNKYLEENYRTGVNENDFRNERQRDIYGDYVIELKDYDFDLAIRESGDFLLYFGSKKSGSIKTLVKARDIWNKFVESNYKNAEPGLMFWSKLSKYSPTNYIGAPIITTNPCVASDTMVATNEGIMEISKVHNPLHIIGDDGEYHPVKWAGQTGEKELFEVKTVAGYEVKATADHKILTENGWKEVGELSRLDRLVLQKAGMFGKAHIDTEMALALGWLIGDGHMSKDVQDIIFYFGKGEKEELLPKFKCYFDKINGKQVKPGESKTETRLKYSSAIARKFHELGVRPWKAHEKEVPSAVFSMDMESVRHFISALFSADGSVQGSKEKGISIRLSSNSIKLLKQVQVLLLQFGILSRLYEERRKNHAKTLPDSNRKPKTYQCRAQHELIISRQSMFRFIEGIGFCISSKNDKFDNLKPTEIYSDNIDTSVSSVERVGIAPVYDITEPITHSFSANGLIVHNCGEVPLEDGGACNLGSLNLSRMVSDPYTDKAKIDWTLMGESIDHLVRFLDNITSWNSKMNPLEKQKKAAENTRRIGLGIMGLADMFNQLGIAYDSDDGLKTLEEAIKFICNRAYLYSSIIAKEKGSFNLFKYEEYSKNPFFKEALDTEVKESIKKNGLRNAGVLSIAPTGTISNIAVGFVLNKKRYLGVSGGIEPIFALYYTRRSESLDRSFKIFHPTVQAYIDMNGLAGSIEKAETDEALMNILPDYFFSTAHKLDPLKRVRMQGIAQRYIDHSISSTVNLPEDIEPEVISNIYIEAWKNGLKGITIYREGSRYPILSTATGKKSEFDEEKDKSFKIKMNGSEVVAKGDDIIMMPDGKLTTVYHAMKKGLMSG